MFRLSVVPRTIFSIRDLMVTTLALAVGITLFSFILTVSPASASTCKNIFQSASGSDDMPIIGGGVAMPAKGCTDAPAQPPVVKGNDPVVKPKPIEKPKPAPKPVVQKPVKPKPSPKPSKPKPSPKPAPAVKPGKPKPATTPQQNVRPHAPVRPNPPVHKTATKKPAKQATKTATPAKAEVKTGALPACAAMIPVPTTDFKFPWLLVTGCMLAALLLGGVAFTRTYMATGHRWPTKLRRFIAGPDHRRIDA